MPIARHIAHSAALAIGLYNPRHRRFLLHSDTHGFDRLWRRVGRLVHRRGFSKARDNPAPSFNAGRASTPLAPGLYSFIWQPTSLVTGGQTVDDSGLLLLPHRVLHHGSSKRLAFPSLLCFTTPMVGEDQLWVVRVPSHLRRSRTTLAKSIERTVEPRCLFRPNDPCCLPEFPFL